MNMRATIIPKSDQINADDLIGRTLTVKITDVSIAAGEQPVTVHFEGDNGKPYKPGKSMCRVMVHLWGDDANKYVGRSMTLYRDPDVRFGGLTVGGIRISHMSHIESKVTMALTETKGRKAAFTVQPLKMDAPPPKQPPADPARTYVDKLTELLSVAPSLPEMDALLTDPARTKRFDELREKRPELAKEVDGAVDAARERLRPPPTNTLPLVDDADEFGGAFA